MGAPDYKLSEKVESRVRAAQRLSADDGVCVHPNVVPYEWAADVLSRYGGVAGSVVMDPFCSSGTVSLAARRLGYGVFGVGDDVVGTALCEGQLVQTTASRIEQEYEQIMNTAAPVRPPESEFWRWAYGRKTLEALMALRGELRHGRETAERMALRVLLAGALHGPRRGTRAMYLSNNMQSWAAPDPEKAVSYWKARGMEPVEVDIGAVLRRRARWFYGESSEGSEWRIMKADPRVVVPEDVWEPPAIVVGRLPQWRASGLVGQWMRTWLLGGVEALSESQRAVEELSSLSRFVDYLRRVWRVCSDVSADSSKLILYAKEAGSPAASPQTVVSESLSATVWRVIDVRKVTGGDGPGWEFVCEKGGGSESGPANHRKIERRGE